MVEKRVRRSVALPRELVEEAQKMAPPALRGNFNQITVVSLRAWIETRKRKMLQNEIAKMAQDLGVQKENEKISRQFSETELDGLS